MTFADGIFRLGVSLRYVGARVAELVDAQDLKSCFPQRKYGFDSRPGHEGPDDSRGLCILERANLFA